MFIDWENIKYSLLNRDNRLPNVQALKEAAGRFGRVISAKAYANWQEGQNLRDPNDLYSVGIEPIYVPTIFIGAGDSGVDGGLRRKNSVDIKLAVDVMEFAHVGTNVQTYVFVTGDGDFIHLVNALRSRGKTVVIIGTSWNTSWQLTSSADKFIPYDVDIDPMTPRAPVKPATQMPIDETFKVLAEVVKYVREKRRPNVFAQVKLLLATRLGSFDEQTYGYSKFKDYMKEAERRGFVKTQTVGLTDRVYMPDEEIESGLAAETPQEVESEAADAARDAARNGQPEERLVRPARAVPQATGRGLDPSDDVHLGALVRFIDLLEQGSPFMSFNYIVNRSAESRLVPMTLPEISGLIDRAIQDGLFLTDTRTILDRVTGEYRDINIFRLNRRHPVVARSLAEESSPELTPVGGA
jgi:uncharacterized LabA/DUF88 family protein